MVTSTGMSVLTTINPGNTTVAPAPKRRIPPSNPTQDLYLFPYDNSSMTIPSFPNVHNPPCKVVLFIVKYHVDGTTPGTQWKIGHVPIEDVPSVSRDYHLPVSVETVVSRCSSAVYQTNRAVSLNNLFISSVERLVCSDLRQIIVNCISQQADLNPSIIHNYRVDYHLMNKKV